MVMCPKDWTTYDFGSYFSILPNNTFPRAVESSSGSVANIHYGDVLVRYRETIDNRTDIPRLVPSVEFKTEAFLQPNDVIFADTAEDETVGKCTQLISAKTRVVAGLHTIPCRPNAATAPGFLGYYLNSALFHDQLIPYITGIKVSSISKSSILKTTLTVPSVPEQRAIAEVLSGFDEHLANLDELIVKKKAIRDGTLESLVSGEQRLGAFKYPWREVPLDSIAYSRRESVGTEPMSMDVELENILPGEGRLVGDTSVRTASSFIFRTGDVLFGRLRPYLRKFWYATNTGVRSGEIWALVAKEEVDSKFLFHLIRTQRFLDSAGKTMGTKMPRADWNLMKSQRFCIPHSLEEQRAIAEVLSGMDEEIRLLEEERVKVERLKLGAMDDLLTGRVRLPIEEEAA